MLLANMFVAEFLVKYCKDKAVIRNQLPPQPDKISAFVQYCERLGVKCNVDTSLEIQQTFDAMKAMEDDKYYANAIVKFFNCIEPA